MITSGKRYCFFIKAICDKLYILSFCLVMLILILISRYTLIETWDFFDNMFFSFTSTWYLVFLFIIFIFNTYKVYSVIETNSLYKIRLENKSNSKNKLIKYAFLLNLFEYIIITIICSFTILIATKFNISFVNCHFYDVSNIIYSLFILIRNFLIINIIIMFILGIYIFFNKTIVLFIIPIFLTILSLFPYNVNKPILNILEMKLFPGYYLINLEYSNFTFEVIITSLYIATLLLILKVMYDYFINRRKDNEI